MRRTHFLLIISLALLVSLSACGIGGGPGAEQAQEATERFLTERNDGTPVSLGGGDAANLPVVGTVERVDGGTLVVKRPIDGTNATIQLDAAVKVSRQADIPLSEIKAGDSITAFGAQQGTVFQAQSLQVGGPAGNGMIRFNRNAGAPPSGGQPGGAPVIIQRRPGDQQPGGGDVMEGQAAPPLVGTVEQITESTLVVKGSDGASTTVQLAEGVQIQKQVDAQVADIQAGVFIVATGTQEGDALHATEVEILPPPSSGL